MKTLLVSIIALLVTINLKAQTFKQMWPADSTFTKFNPSPPIFSFPPLLGSPTPNLNSTNRHLFNFNHNIEIAHNMPNAKLNGFDNMPIAKLDGYYTIPIKRITLDGFTMLMPPKKPIIPTLKSLKINLG